MQQIIDQINSGHLVMHEDNYVTFDVGGFTVFHVVLKTEDIPPQITGARLGAASNVLFVDFSEPVSGQTGLTLNASGGPVTLTYADGEGTNKYTLLLSRSVSGETVTLDHSTGIQDLAGNGLPSVSGIAVS